MKQIQNTSFQGRYVFLNTGNGTKDIWLSPGKSIVVKESSITPQVRTLADRRLLKILNA